MDRQIHQRASSRQQIDRRMRLHILPVLGGHRIDQVTRADVQNAVIGWAETLAPSTVKLTYTYLSGMMKSAVLDGLIRASPCVGIRLPRRERELVRPLSTEVVQRIVENIWHAYQPMVVFCAGTGLRGAEMRGLTWDRVNLGKGLVTVDRQLISNDSRKPRWGPPKTTSSVRTLHIGEATIALLESLPRVGPLVFHYDGGLAFNRNAASGAWQRMREKVPEAGAGWHQLRHYHASVLISGGLSPVAVAHRLGHQDATETLQTYAHLFQDDDVRAARISDGLVGLGCSVGAGEHPELHYSPLLVPTLGIAGS
jgi:integrase